MSQRAWGIILITVAFGLLAFVAYKNSAKRRIPIIFSPRAELVALWQEYKKEYIEPNTFRVLDKQKDSITTSEGQSYAMLRAVWMDDKETFDNVWGWTKDNLWRDDKLFSWLFGKKPNGTYGVVEEEGGANTASDADIDIALSLIFASNRWNEETYLNEARAIINAIWEEEVIMIRGRPYLAANNIEKDSSSTIVVNPSYFAPYAFRIFGTIDTNHDWNGLVDTSYDVLEKSLAAPLDRPRSAHIPPDWILLDRQSGAIISPASRGLKTTTSFDALRTPWRIALDWVWFKEPRAKEVLGQMKFFSEQWRENALLYTSYTHDGTPAMRNQTAAFYGGTIGYFMVADPENARVIHDTKLQVLFNPDSNTWKVPLGYYDDNWTWFGIALYNNLLPNLATITTSPSPQ